MITSSETKLGGLATLVQIVVLLLGLAGVVVGVFGVYVAAFPGPCGDDPGPGLGVILTWVVDVPAGLLALVVGLLVKRGSPSLRKICIWISVVILAFPAVATFLLQRRHCP
jgi:hypothetical protein